MKTTKRWLEEQNALMTTTQQDLFVGRITQLTNHVPDTKKKVMSAKAKKQLTDIFGYTPAVNVPTSIEAADRASKSSKTRVDALVLWHWLMERGEHGATDDEIITKFGWTGNYGRPRRWSLVRQHLVYRTHMKRKTRSGCPAYVWRAV